MTGRRFGELGDFGDGNEDEIWRRTRAHMQPGQVDQSIRSAIQMCWMMIRPSNRTPEELERQIRRILDRALEDLREDFDAFS